MSLNYDQDFVKWSYHYAKPRKLSPTKSNLKDWDKNLFQNYETDLVRIMSDLGIRRTRGNKSKIVLLAVMSKRSSSALRVRDACKYFKHVAAIDLE